MASNLIHAYTLTLLTRQPSHALLVLLSELFMMLLEARYSNNFGSGVDDFISFIAKNIFIREMTLSRQHDVRIQDTLYVI
jgi:hypothetical protein